MVSASLFLGRGSARPASPWPPTTWKRSPRRFCCTSCVQPVGLCPSPPEKWSHGHLHHSSRRKQGRRPWFVPSSLLEGRWGNGQVGQSFVGNWNCVTVAHGLPLLEGRSMASALLVLRGGGVWSWPPSWRFLKGGGEETMVSACLLLRKKGGLWSSTPTSYIQKESGKVVMTSALVLL